MSQTRAFKLNISLLSLAGAWNTSKKTKNKLYQFLITGISFSLYFLTIIQIIINYRNLSDSFYNLAGELQSPLKLLFFLRNFQEIQQIVKILQENQLEAENLKQYNILKEATNFSDKVQKIYYIYTLTGAWAMFIPPYFKQGYQLCVVAYIPDFFKHLIYFECFYIYIVFCTIICISINISTDSFLYISWIQLGAQFDCICNTLKNLKEKDLEKCVERYKNVMECVKMLTSASRGLIAIQIVTATISMCSILLLTSQQRGLTSKLFEMICYQIAMTFEIFGYCYFGQHITNKSSKVFYATFQSRWYNKSGKFQKSMQIFMLQVQEPVIFYGWNVLPINLETFKGILQKSWAFYIALKNIQEIEP